MGRSSSSQRHKYYLLNYGVNPATKLLLIFLCVFASSWHTWFRPVCVRTRTGRLVRVKNEGGRACKGLIENLSTGQRRSAVVEQFIIQRHLRGNDLQKS